MKSTDPARVAQLLALLQSTEQQLLAGAELCREARAALGQPALIRSASHGATDVGAADGAQPRAELTGPQELAGRLRGLAVQLTHQAEVLHGAADEGLPESASLAATALQVSASEAERARIARDLHDGPAQYFANAVFETEYLRKLLARDPAAVGEGLERLRESLQQGVREIRQCLFDLRLPAVGEMGLVALLHGYLPEYERQYGLNVEASLPEDELPLQNDQAIAIFRILQEALNNARKHAGASLVRVKLRRRGAEVVLQVEDNGGGFTPGQAKPGHYGLVGMQERAQLIGGRLEVQGRPGKGARVALHQPLQ
ncbi:MAG TPA: sensor histidine kinase [Chloroflexota bacterium]|jgi:signal transduction histidine kinase